MSGNVFYLGRFVCFLNRPTLWLRFISACLLFSGLSFSALANLDSAIPLKIESQKLSEALIELGSQAEISIVFPSTLPLDKTSSAIDGIYTPRQALEILLADQSIQWQSYNSRVVSLSTKPLAPKVAPIFQPTPLTEIIVIGEQVTGSRIKRLDWEGSAPVDIITEAEISARGVQAVADYLRFIPAVSGNSTSTAVSNGGDGTATITLRGLPAANTLVLLNGRRIANSGRAGDSVDLNSIPLVAVERIEVLKDGASSIYGSDAIAGVVNIILKQEYDGLLVDQYVSQTSRGDLTTTNTSFIAGTSTDSASYLVSGSHFDQDPIYSRERELSENADGRPQGGVDSRSSATPYARITLPNDPNDLNDDSVVILRDNVADPSLPSSFRPATSEDRYNFREATSSVSPSIRSSLYFNSVHTTGDNSQLVTTLGYTKTESQVTLAPFPIFTANEQPTQTVSAANPYNPFGVDITDIRRRVLELGPRFENFEEKSRRFNLVWENFGNEINWDMAFNWNLTDAGEDFFGILDVDRTREALAADCLVNPACVPLNLFGPPGSITEDQLAYLRTHETFIGHSKLYELTANGDTVLESFFLGPLSLAGGITSRKERAKFSAKSDVGTARPATTNGDRSIFETYIEASLPLLEHKSFAHSLELELATRYSRYSDFGDTNNPKMGLRYRPIQELLFRSTISKGFRAPSLNQLNVDQKQSFDFLDDPCARAVNVGVLMGCPQQSDPTIRQFVVITGGNSDLSPEESLSKTLGIVWTPRNLSQLYISADWFWIHQDDIIDSRPQLILDQNAEFSLFADQVIRDGQGNIIRLIANNLNVGSLNVRGIDATLRYRVINTDTGNYVFSVNGSYIRDYLQKLAPNLPAEDISGTFVDQASAGAGAIPRLKMNAGLSWSYHNWEINYNVFFVDELTESLPFTDFEHHINSWTTQNLQLNYLAGRLKNLRVTVGVDNIFDHLPPFSASAFNDNYDPRTYEIKGRNWYGQIRYQF
jgi:iron complex outermembrane receptor protein